MKSFQSFMKDFSTFETSENSSIRSLRHTTNRQHFQTRPNGIALTRGGKSLEAAGLWLPQVIVLQAARLQGG